MAPAALPDASAESWPIWAAPGRDRVGDAAGDLADSVSAGCGCGAEMDTAGPPSVDGTLPRVAAFEAGALRVLAAIRVGERTSGRLLIGTNLASALTELEDAAAIGVLTPEAAECRRDRLVALNEAAIRLRALAELRAGGYVGDGDFDRKRRTILEPLAARLFPSA